MALLVTGGAGYIGSHVVHLLLEHGHKLVVLDNLSTGRLACVAPDAIFMEGDAGDRALVRRLVAEHGIDSVIHLAASIVVEDSVARPLDYYRNNFEVSVNLIDAAIAAGVKYFLLSSTASVYGSAQSDKLDESARTAPINPYGRSKLMAEWILEDAARAHGLRYAALRYFNVAGADPKGRTGHSCAEATHLIKRANQVALGRRSSLTIFGTDYQTRDGTCVRDYVHVSDVAEIHMRTLENLWNGGPSGVLNCGYGHGTSVRDVVAAVERVSGRKIAVREGPRRPGDAASVVADTAALRARLDWAPRHDDLDEIVRSDLQWERRIEAQAPPVASLLGRLAHR